MTAQVKGKALGLWMNGQFVGSWSLDAGGDVLQYDIRHSVESVCLASVVRSAGRPAVTTEAHHRSSVMKKAPQAGLSGWSVDYRPNSLSYALRACSAVDVKSVNTPSIPRR